MKTIDELPEVTSLKIDDAVPLMRDGDTKQYRLPFTVTAGGDIGIGTDEPIFNDDGTTGANVGKWVAIDGGASGFAAYLGIGGTVPGTTDRVGGLNFYNWAMGGADHRTASIFSFNDGATTKGNLVFSTSPNIVGTVERMRIDSNGNIGINHLPGAGSRLQIMGETADDLSYALVLLKNGDIPFALFRDDGKVFIGTTDPNGVVAPASNGVLCVGTTGQFSVTPDGDALQRSLQLTGGTRPSANAANRGKFWYVPGGSGVADTLEFCRKDASNNYDWVAII